MAIKHDQVTAYYFSLDEDEINTIILALRRDGESELADEIYDQINGEEEDVGVRKERDWRDWR